MTPENSETELLFADIGASLTGRGVTVGAMFGAQALMKGGKAICCLKDGAFAAKLGAGTSAHTLALDLPGATLWDPSGKHRPFKDWVEFPIELEDCWGEFAEAAADFSLR